MANRRFPRSGCRRSFVLLSLAGVLFIALGFEVAVRAFSLAPPLNRQIAGLMVPDPYLPYRPRPNGVWMSSTSSGRFLFETRHSSLGLRDVEHAVAKPPGSFRILGLGDSFTYGSGANFEDTYLVRLQRRLNGRPGRHPPVEIVKAGIPRYFPEPERLFLEHYGLALHPDLLLVGFTPNDVGDTVMGLDAVKPTPDGLLMTREAAQIGPAGYWLFVHSHAARALISRWVSYRVRVEHPLFWDDIYQANGRHEKAWLTVEKEYGRMVNLAARKGARLVILHIPDHPPWNRKTAYPPTRLAAWATAHGAFLIDTLPALRAAAAAHREIYWSDDLHCTGEGYRVIAQAVFRGLTERGLVP